MKFIKILIALFFLHSYAAWAWDQDKTLPYKQAYGECPENAQNWRIFEDYPVTFSDGTHLSIPFDPIPIGKTLLIRIWAPAGTSIVSLAGESRQWIGTSVPSIGSTSTDPGNDVGSIVLHKNPGGLSLTMYNGNPLNQGKFFYFILKNDTPESIEITSLHINIGITDISLYNKECLPTANFNFFTYTSAKTTVTNISTPSKLAQVSLKPRPGTTATTNTISSYEWKAGSIVKTEANPIFVPGLATGTPVTLTVRDSSGKSHSVTKAVPFFEEPIVETIIPKVKEIAIENTTIYAGDLIKIILTEDDTSTPTTTEGKLWVWITNNDESSKFFLVKQPDTNEVILSSDQNHLPENELLSEIEFTIPSDFSPGDYTVRAVYTASDVTDIATINSDLIISQALSISEPEKEQVILNLSSTTGFEFEANKEIRLSLSETGSRSEPADLWVAIASEENPKTFWILTSEGPVKITDTDLDKLIENANPYQRKVTTTTTTTAITLPSSLSGTFNLYAVYVKSGGNPLDPDSQLSDLFFTDKSNAITINPPPVKVKLDFLPFKVDIANQILELRLEETADDQRTEEVDLFVAVNEELDTFDTPEMTSCPLPLYFLSGLKVDNSNNVITKKHVCDNVLVKKVFNKAVQSTENLHVVPYRASGSGKYTFYALYVKKDGNPYPYEGSDWRSNLAILTINVTASGVQVVDASDAVIENFIIENNANSGAGNLEPSTLTLEGDNEAVIVDVNEIYTLTQDDLSTDSTEEVTYKTQLLPVDNLTFYKNNSEFDSTPSNEFSFTQTEINDGLIGVSASQAGSFSFDFSAVKDGAESVSGTFNLTVPETRTVNIIIEGQGKVVNASSGKELCLSTDTADTTNCGDAIKLLPEQQTLTAIQKEGFQFEKWECNGGVPITGDGAENIDISTCGDGDVNITVTFSQIPEPLTVSGDLTVAISEIPVTGYYFINNANKENSNVEIDLFASDNVSAPETIIYTVNDNINNVRIDRKEPLNTFTENITKFTQLNIDAGQIRIKLIDKTRVGNFTFTVGVKDSAGNAINLDATFTFSVTE